MKLKDEILFELISSVRKSGNEIVIPNFYFGRYEFDLFRLLPNGNIYEYEIKTSRQDFRSDFEKKRRVFRGMDVVEVSKHEEIEFGKYPANKFFFVVPEGLVKPEEVPLKLGLIYYSNKSYGPEFKLIRNPKFINKEKIVLNPFDLLKKMAFRELNLRLKIYKLTKTILKKQSL